MADHIVPDSYDDVQDFCQIGTLEELFGALERSTVLTDRLLEAIRDRMPFDRIDVVEELRSLREDILNFEHGHEIPGHETWPGT